jgi:lysozyme family protein
MTNQQSRQQLFDTMIIKENITDTHGNILLSNIPARVRNRVNLMFANKGRYEAVSHKFINPGLRWWLVAVIHEMEALQDFSKYLGNGQSWARKTTIVPVGRGPFRSFEEGAIDALKLQGADEIEDWSIGNVLYFLEGYNGYGYSKYHNINTPYLWSGSNHYTSGKYVTDGNYDPHAVSLQLGIALLLKTLLLLGIK